MQRHSNAFFRKSEKSVDKDAGIIFNFNQLLLSRN